MDVSGIGTTAGIHATSGASASWPPQQKMASLFDSIDSSGSGSITKTQFDQAFQSKTPPTAFQKQGADAIFGALDPSSTGNVSRQDFISGMSKLMSSLRADGTAQSGSQAQDSLTASLQSLNQIATSSVPAKTAPGMLINQLV